MFKDIKDLQDKAVLLGWIIIVLFIMTLLWVLTAPAQKHYLFRTVNNVFVSLEDPRRVMPTEKQFPSRNGLLGYWFEMYNSSDYMFVFAAFKDGILIPIGAIVSENGHVEELIPLSSHAVQVFDNLPESVLQIYITRIERAFNESEGRRQ